MKYNAYRMEVWTMSLVDNLQKDILPFLAEEASTASLLKRILLFLEDGEFVQADAYCEKVLDTEPENPLAYLCKLMAARRISSLNDLASAQYIVDNDTAFKKALRFAPQEMLLHLQQLNMQIYANSIDACRSRAKIHMSHGELKETAQQYHDAMKLWEDSRETLPNAEKIYTDLANEVSDFNWKLLLHNRQCPDDTQLIARSIPFNNERWYLNAVKWADTEKKAYFESVARDTLWGAHLKCLECVKSKNTHLAQIWANHYKAAVSADDPLAGALQALVNTDGFTKFAADAPAGMLTLIKRYKAVFPDAAAEMKAILQDYYVRIFQSLLDFAGTESPVVAAPSRMDADTYAITLAQQEAKACNPSAKITPVQEHTPAEIPATDPVWTTEAVRQITAQMVAAVSEDLSPYGVVSTYLIAAKELTIRYGKKDGIVTEPLLFRFICGYYADAIAQAEAEQVSAIQTKFNDFLIDTVRLNSATAEIATEASSYMQGSTLPYHIYLARITNNYSVKAEELIPPQVVEYVEKWHQNLEKADPKQNCYWISDQQDAIKAAFTAAENAINNCRQYTDMLQKSLETPYQQVLTSSGDGSEEISDGWDQKMSALQDHCNEWADELEGKLNQAQELNNAKLILAQKHIKVKETWQLILSIGMQLLFIFTALVFAQAATAALKDAWNLMESGNLPQRTTFYAINVLAPLLAGIFSLANGMAAPTHGNKDRAKSAWLFAIFSVLTYVFIYWDIDTVLFAPDAIGSTGRTSFITVAVLVLVAIFRTLLEVFLCKLRNYTRSNATKVSCRVGSITAKVVGLVQILACLAVTALYICCLMLTL